MSRRRWLPRQGVLVVVYVLSVVVVAVVGAHLMSPTSPTDATAPLTAAIRVARVTTAVPHVAARATTTGPALPAHATVPAPSPDATTRLTRALAVLPLGRWAEFSVAVRNNRAGVTYRYLPSATYETASVAKLAILTALLLRAQDAGRSLTGEEKSLAARMMRASDNAAATVLFRRVGGAGGLGVANRRLGLVATTPHARWGLTRTTVGDQMLLVNQALRGAGPLSAASRAYVMELMTTVHGDQRWGVPAGARAGETAAVKNGWLSRGTEDGRWIINSVGRITGPRTDLTVAVLSHGHSGMSAGVAATEKIIKLVRQYLAW